MTQRVTPTPQTAIVMKQLFEFLLLFHYCLDKAGFILFAILPRLFAADQEANCSGEFMNISGNLSLPRLLK